MRATRAWVSGLGDSLLPPTSAAPELVCLCLKCVATLSPGKGPQDSRELVCALHRAQVKQHPKSLPPPSLRPVQSISEMTHSVACVTSGGGGLRAWLLSVPDEAGVCGLAYVSTVMGGWGETPLPVALASFHPINKHPHTGQVQGTQVKSSNSSGRTRTLSRSPHKQGHAALVPPGPGSPPPHATPPHCSSEGPYLLLSHKCQRAKNVFGKRTRQSGSGKGEGESSKFEFAFSFFL